MAIKSGLLMLAVILTVSFSQEDFDPMDELQEHRAQYENHRALRSP